MATSIRNDKTTSACSPDRGGGGTLSKSRGNKLAKRARSFKEDLFERLSHMRSPGAGSSSRHVSRSSADVVDSGGSSSSSSGRSQLGELEVNVRQVHVTLKHLKDVVSKNKLEMLPGNGTVVLETVTAIHAVLKNNLLTNQSSTLVSATNQVYQSLARLIKLCDDYLLIGDKALTREVVFEVVQLVEDAVKNLVSLAQEKMSANNRQSSVVSKSRLMCDRSSLDSQRSSLPDIPLTPRERAILEQTSGLSGERHAQSSESVLLDLPPPKPPHPDRTGAEMSYRPPLPPKRRHKLPSADLSNNIEQLSLRSRSPEDSLSLLSASAGSLDSVLNHSRDEEEDEMKNLIDSHEDSDQLDENILTTHGLNLNGSTQSCCCWDSSSSTSTEQPVSRLKTRESPVFLPDTSITGLDSSLRTSQAESGISSLPSRRSSDQSYTTRSSQQSYSSHEFYHTERKLISSGDSGKYSLLSDTMTGLSMETSSSYKQSKTTTTTTMTSMKLNCCNQHDQQQPHHNKVTSTSTSPVHVRTSSPCSNVMLVDVPCCHDNLLNTSPRHTSGKSSPCTAMFSCSGESPPALPAKSRPKRDKYESQYDNVPDSVTMETKMIVQQQQQSSSSCDQVDHVQQQFSALHNFVCDSQKGVSNLSEQQCATAYHSKSAINLVNHSGEHGHPPPLPLKKKHIMAYMEMFGNASHGSTTEFLRHSVHAYNVHQSEWQQHHQRQDVVLSSTQSCSFNTTTSSSPYHSIDRRSGPGLPPALPPKKSRNVTPRQENISSSSSPPATPHFTTPKLTREEEFIPKVEALLQQQQQQQQSLVTSTPVKHSKQTDGVALVKSHKTDEHNSDVSDESFLLDSLDVSEYLVMKKADEDGPEVRGGHPIALVVHATKTARNDFLYQEAFLTTYRTFLSPLDLLKKLRYRHDRFINSPDTVRQRAAREAFSLLVRVVDDLTLSDLDQAVLEMLLEFVQQLLCRGDLSIAKALRTKLIEKHAAKQEYSKYCSLFHAQNISTKQSSLLDFKCEHVAEQMTLLDADLFLRIEVPEVLIWAQEQNEERSPNLTRFTEHFNNMSYWARSRILDQNEAKDRERYVTKFIKIMKHLRRINNFNSYLALLSALDSAPIRRLEWQKHITEGLKEYCALIDSSSSFRAYRQALAETHPPCIPYIGLVLQDLTFVHIGNSDLLPGDGGINFSKRWQQYNIVENMKRFKKGRYQFKKNERIISFFNNFEDSLTEEAMWQISESIKPRGVVKHNSNNK